MKDVTWIMQSNLTSELHRWIYALEQCSSAYREVEIVPFSNEVPDVTFVTKHAIAHGTTTMMRGVPKKNWSPGIFFDPFNFKPSLWKKKYGHELLNYDGAVMELKQVDFPAEFAFIRPNGDFKDFSGSVVSHEGLEKFRKSVQEGGFDFNDELEVFVAPIKNIFEEYRCFIVNGECVSASKYRLRTILDKKAGAPGHVIRYANEIAKIWSPEKAYVLDVCITDRGEIKVLELNCFNASGVYAAPLEPIIEAVEAMYPIG